jgi:serine protease
VSVLADRTDCATEGTCSFSGTRQVRHGANDQYADMTFTSSTACSNAVFGDPIHSVQETCSDSSIAR